METLKWKQHIPYQGNDPEVLEEIEEDGYNRVEFAYIARNDHWVCDIEKLEWSDDVIVVCLSRKRKKGTTVKTFSSLEECQTFAQEHIDRQDYLWEQNN